MRKPDSLRAALEAAFCGGAEGLPNLRDNPDQLRLYIDQGAIAGRSGRTLSFEYRYTLTVGIEDFTGPTVAFIVPILAWLRDNQPDLFANFRKNGSLLAYQAEVLDSARSDIYVDLQLTEAVIVTRRADGGYGVDFPPEPVLDSFGPPADGTHLKSLYLGEVLIAGSEDA